MKIAVLIKEFSIYKGGLEKYTFNFCKNLAERNHEVHVFSNKYQCNNKDEFNWHKVPVINKPSWLKVINYSKNVEKKLKYSNYDIVYSMTQASTCDIYRLGDGVIKQWIYQLYPNPILRWIKFMIRPVYLSNLYLEGKILKNQYITCIANSEYVKNIITQYYNVDINKIHVIYNGVDTKRFDYYKIDTFRHRVRDSLGIMYDVPLILFIGNNWKRKGLYTLLNCIKVLKNNNHNHHLLVVGKGNIKTFNKLLINMNIQDRVHFANHTDSIEMYYAAGDLFVLPTMNDPFANVCLEAMACGLPVITTSTNGASELIKENVNGYVIDLYNDIKTFVERIIQCKDIENMKKLGYRSYKIAQQYTIKNNIDENIKIMDDIINEKKRSNS